MEDDSFDSTVDIQKWLHLVLKELDTCHLKVERCLLFSPSHNVLDKSVNLGGIE